MPNGISGLREAAILEWRSRRAGRLIFGSWASQALLVYSLMVRGAVSLKSEHGLFSSACRTPPVPASPLQYCVDHGGSPLPLERNCALRLTNCRFDYADPFRQTSWLD